MQASAAYDVREWVTQHGARYREVCAHPATTSVKASVYRRLLKLATACGMDADDLKRMLIGGAS